MRLDDTERKALSRALQNVDGDVYLFGSRVRDDLRGGDIDILIFSDADPFALSRQVATRFFLECEEKIDVVVMKTSGRTAEQEAFLASIQRVPLVMDADTAGV